MPKCSCLETANSGAKPPPVSAWGQVIDRLPKIFPRFRNLHGCRCFACLPGRPGERNTHWCTIHGDCSFKEEEDDLRVGISISNRLNPGTRDEVTARLARGPPASVDPPKAGPWPLLVHLVSAPLDEQPASERMLACHTRVLVLPRKVTLRHYSLV